MVLLIWNPCTCYYVRYKLIKADVKECHQDKHTIEIWIRNKQIITEGNYQQNNIINKNNNK